MARSRKSALDALLADLVLRLQRMWDDDFADDSEASHA